MKPLVITALYDIGRSDWKDFSMSYHTYLHWMQKALNLRSHMVVFTEPKFEDKIREMRSNVDPTGEMTTYVINTLQDLEVYKKWNDGICEVMQDEVFLHLKHSILVQCTKIGTWELQYIIFVNSIIQRT